MGHDPAQRQDPVHQDLDRPAWTWRGGYTHFAARRRTDFLQTRGGLLDRGSQCCWAAGSAEELLCDDITTGASNDLERATKLARSMVTRYGMSESLGTQVYGEANHEVFLGRDLAEHSDYSPETAQRIDAEVSRIITEAHERTRKALSERSEQMQLMAKVLLERETVEGKAVTALLDNQWDEYVAHEDEERRKVEEADAAEQAAAEAAAPAAVLEVSSSGAEVQVGKDGSTTVVDASGTKVTLPPRGGEGKGAEAKGEAAGGDEKADASRTE